MNNPLPADWAILPLGDLARVYSGGTPSRGVSAYWGGSIPWVTTTEIDFGYITSTHQTITEAGLKASAARIAPPGTLLLAMYGQGKTRGKSALLEIPAAMNQACAAIEVSGKLDSRYLLHYLSLQYDAIRSMSNAGSQDNLSGELVRKIPIAVPPMAEQHTIGEAIDDVAAIVSRLEKAVAKKQAIKQGMMQQLLTGRTRLPGYRDDWIPRRLESVLGKLQAGVSVNSVTDPGTYSVLKTSSVSGGAFDPSERKTVAPADIKRVKVSPVADSLVISRMNTPALVGEVGYVETDWPEIFLPDRLWLATKRTAGAVSMRWLSYVLSSSNYRERLMEIATGTSGSMKNIARSAFLGLSVCFPSIEEQTSIAGVLSDLDHELQGLRARLAKAQDIKQGMMQQLLTGRTRLPVPETAA